MRDATRTVRPQPEMNAMNGGVAALLLLWLAMACHDDRPNNHVYASPPPKTVPAPAAPIVDEAPLGTNGPGARITSVLDATTGAPVALTNVVGDVDVMTLAALGPGNLGEAEDVRVELVIRGSRDTTLTLPLGRPAPRMIAHAFRLPAGVLGRGQSTVRARLVAGKARVVVESTPIFASVWTPD
jgi:hypothetical protein